MSISDSPSRGKKQCHSCMKFVGVRNQSCPNCDKSFEKKEEVVAEKVVSNLPSRGKKQCHSCMKFVGARNSICPNCDKSFEKESVPYCRLKVVLTPGKYPNKEFCSVKPKGVFPHTDEEVKDWVEELLIVGVDDGVLYMPEALAYFARHCYWNVFSDDYNRVKGLIHLIAPDIIKQLV